jgi:murein DD-endopeptidase MepM/ murein hydrolase activator NlpD
MVAMRPFAACTPISLALVFLVGSAATAAPSEQQRIVPGGGAPKTVSRSVSGDDASQRRHVIADDSAGGPEHPTVTALRSRWPVRGPITSDFGPRRAFARFHSGIDIAAKPETPCRIAAAGTVVFAGWQNGYGKTIIVEHGDRIHTLYGHLSRLVVSRGQRVKQGAVIGLTGTTGHASGPHLHYEILVNGRPVDPGPYLAAAPGVHRASARSGHTTTAPRVSLGHSEESLILLSAYAPGSTMRAREDRP